MRIKRNLDPLELQVQIQGCMHILSTIQIPAQKHEFLKCLQSVRHHSTFSHPCHANKTYHLLRTQNDLMVASQVQFSVCHYMTQSYQQLIEKGKTHFNIFILFPFIPLVLNTAGSYRVKENICWNFPQNCKTFRQNLVRQNDYRQCWLHLLSIRNNLF